MLTDLTTKSVINIALILLTIIMGFLLHRSGRPYSNGLLAIHKLATVVFVILIIKMIIGYTSLNGLNNGLVILLSVALLSVIGILFSGGALSLDKGHDFMLPIHKVSTLTFLFSMTGIFYIVLRHHI